jgi:hypothetical protein
VYGGLPFPKKTSRHLVTRIMACEDSLPSAHSWSVVAQGSRLKSSQRQDAWLQGSPERRTGVARGRERFVTNANAATMLMGTRRLKAVKRVTSLTIKAAASSLRCDEQEAILVFWPLTV